MNRNKKFRLRGRWGGGGSRDSPPAVSPRPPQSSQQLAVQRRDRRRRYARRGTGGGTIIFDNSSVPDSTDPGNTYYANQWNVIRLYGRTLVTYKSATGQPGATRSCRTWPPAWARSATTG